MSIYLPAERVRQIRSDFGHLSVWPFLRNPVLLLGILIIGAILLVALRPDWFAPYGPNEKGPVFQEINGEIVVRPYPPSPLYPLGSDPEARDLLSRIIHGARITLSIALLAAILRIVTGVVLGWVATRSTNLNSHAILTLSKAAAAIPSLLFAYLIIAALSPSRGPLVFIIGIGLTGWTPWAQLIYYSVRRIEAEPYMEAANAVGSTARFKIRHYMLPNVLPVVIPTIAQEMVNTLLLLAELGFIGLFLGSLRPIPIDDLLRGYRPDLPMPEWGGMLAGTRFYIFRSAWIPLAPTGAFAVTILGFYLLAEGLRQLFDMPQRRKAARLS